MQADRSRPDEVPNKPSFKVVCLEQIEGLAQV